MRSLQMSDEQYQEHQARIASYKAQGRVRLVLDGRTVPSPTPTPKFYGSKLEKAMGLQIFAAKLPIPLQQYKPIPGRKYRLDFAWVEQKLALEVDGMVHRIKGRFEKSFEREFLLLQAGWKVLHVGGKEVRNGKALDWLKVLLHNT